MSTQAASYVRRHVIRFVNRTKKSLMFQLATVADESGLARAYTQRDAAGDMGAALPTVKRAFQQLMKPPEGAHHGQLIEKLGNGRYQILGLPEHDPWTCGNDECRAEAEATRDAGGKLSEKKRRQAAERMRRMRARQRAAREAASEQR